MLVRPVAKLVKGVAIFVCKAAVSTCAIIKSKSASKVVLNVVIAPVIAGDSVLNKSFESSKPLTIEEFIFWTVFANKGEDEKIRAAPISQSNIKTNKIALIINFVVVRGGFLLDCFLKINFLQQQRAQHSIRAYFFSHTAFLYNQVKLYKKENLQLIK